MGDSLVRKALSWLAHPVSVVALVVLVVNDHVLKAAFGGWWTGKLSDVAGLVFFPALVAVVLAAVGAVARGDFSRLALGAVAVTGVGFVWVKATWAGAATASAVLTAVTGPFTGGPSFVRADVTDLLALPALGLAAWVAAGASRGVRRGAPSGVSAQGVGPRRGGRRERYRRALAVALVPLAILASVATGPGARPEASVVEDGQGGWVVAAGGCEDAPCFGLTEYRLTDHGWVLEGEPQPRPTPIPLACSEAQPDECFRTVPGKMAVEQSHDGGATWKNAWAATAEDLRALRDAYGALGTGQEDHLQSSGVGVFDGADGMTVVVGNRVDGLLVRGPGGHWERVAFEGLSCCSTWKLVPLPTRWMPYGAALPPAIAWGAAALLVAGTFTLLVADRRARRASERATSSRERWAWASALAALVLAALSAIVTGPLGESSPAQDFSGTHFGLTAVLFVPAAFMNAALAFGVAGGWSRRLWWRMWLVALPVAVVVGVAVFAVPGADWWDALVAAVVGAPCVWIAGRFAVARGEAWGISSRLEPPPWLPVNPLGSKEVVPGDAAAGPATVGGETLGAAHPSAESVDQDLGGRGDPANLGDPGDPGDPGDLKWTGADALALQCVRRDRIAISLQWVLAEAQNLEHSYPGLAQLEVSLGALEASGLVKVVRPGWFKATRRGRTALRQGRRLAATPGLSQREAIVTSLREVPCKPGRVNIGQDAYDEAIRRHLGR